VQNYCKKGFVEWFVANLILVDKWVNGLKFVYLQYKPSNLAFSIPNIHWTLPNSRMDTWIF
jgi:hypothetical protein